MQKKIRLLLCALILPIVFSSAFALSVSVQSQAEKGAALEITGNANPGKLSLQIFSGNWLLKEKEINAKHDGFFSFDYNTGFSEPSGEWKVVASQGKDKNYANLSVVPSKESAFLLIKFFSPSAKNFANTEKIQISVKITDSGNRVERANVFAWVPGLEKILLSEKENGSYEGSAFLPLSIPPGDYNLFITAEKAYSASSKAGGENILPISVKRPEISLKVLAPTLYSARVGKPFEIRIAPEYSTGAQADSIELYAEISGKKINFEKKENLFTAQYTPLESEIGNRKITVFGKDNFGNSGKKEIDLEITGLEGDFLEKNFIFIALFAVGFAIVFFAASHKLKKRKSAAISEGKKNEIRKKIKNLEERFYNKGEIDRKAFEENLRKFKEELNELQRKD